MHDTRSPNQSQLEHEVKLDRHQEFGGVSKSPSKRKKYETGKVECVCEARCHVHVHDTRTPNQSQLEHEVKLDRHQEFGAVSKSPTKRKKYETGKDMEKVSDASDSTTDLKSNVSPEDSSLALRIDRKNEELCTEKVSRCFQTKSEPTTSEPTTSPVRTKDFADTQTKADVPSAQNVTPNRNKSTRHKPKRSFSIWKVMIGAVVHRVRHVQRGETMNLLINLLFTVNWIVIFHIHREKSRREVGRRTRLCPHNQTWIQ